MENINLSQEEIDKRDFNNGFKKIKIKDNDIEYEFIINLFNAEEGLKFFIDNINNNEKITINSVKTLLKQAVLVDKNNSNSQNNQPFNYETAITIFRNPLTILKLATKIIDFQKLFMINSED